VQEIRSAKAFGIHIPPDFERDLKPSAARSRRFYNQQFLTAAGIASSGLSECAFRRGGRGRPCQAGRPAPASWNARRGDYRACQSAKELCAVLHRALLRIDHPCVITLTACYSVAPNSAVGTRGLARKCRAIRRRSGWQARADIAIFFLIMLAEPPLPGGRATNPLQGRPGR